MDGVDADAAHALAKAHASEDFVKRVDAIERLDGRGLKCTIDGVLGSGARIDDVLAPRNVHMSGRQGNDEGAQSGKPYTGRDGPVFEENKAAAIGQVTNATHRPPVHVDLDLDAAAVWTVNVRDRVAIRPALGLCVPAVKAEVNGLIVADERLIVHRNDGAVTRLLDVFMPASVHDLVALRGDGLKALILQLEALIDCGLTMFGFRHPVLLLDEPFAVEPVSVTLRPGFLLLDGKLLVQDRLPLLSLLRLLDLLLWLEVLLFQRLLLLEMLLLQGLLLLLLDLLLRLEVLLFQRLLLLKMLLLQGLLLLLLDLLLRLEVLLLLRIVLLWRLGALGVMRLRLLWLLSVGLGLLRLALPVLLLLQPLFALFFLLLRRLRLGEDDLRFRGARYP